MTTGKKGKLGFRLQSNPLPYSSKDGSASPGRVGYFPRSGFLKVPATSLGLAPQIQQNELDIELGQGLWPTGGFRAGYYGEGEISLQPRLEDNFGWFLYALTGKILCEFDGPSVDNGVREHAFVADETESAGNTPWLQLLRYDPSLGEGSDLWETYDDSRVLSWALNIPAQAVATVDMAIRSRVIGFLGALKAIDRGMLVGPVAPAASSLTALAEDGSATTLVDDEMSWEIGEHAGKTVYVEEKGLRDISTNINTTLFISTGTAVSGTDPYEIGLPVWFECTGGTVTTATFAADTFATDELNGLKVFLSGIGWVTVTDTETDSIDFTGGSGDAVTAATLMAIPTKAMGGTIRSVRVPQELYDDVDLNSWMTVQGKGIARINRKVTQMIDTETFYFLYIDGEFNEEVEAGDYVAVLDATNPTDGAGSTTVSVEDTVNFTAANAYDDAYIAIWDQDGVLVGITRILLTDADSTVVYLEDALSRAPLATDTYAVFDQEAAVTLADAETPITIPLTSTPDTYFKVLDLPFAGRKLPVRQVTATMNYQANDPGQDTLLGAYEMDDITILSGRLEFSFTYRIKSQALYNQIFTGNTEIVDRVKRFSSDILTTDVVARTVAPATIGTSSEKYGLEVLAPHVEWSMQGAPVLSGRDVIELNFNGLVRIGGGDTLPTDITGVTVNATSGAVTDADLDSLDSDVLVGKFVCIKSGTGAGQIRMIAEYIDNTGATGTIVPHRPWTEAPDGSSVLDVEDHYAVILLTNGRDSYAADIPSIDSM